MRLNIDAFCQCDAKNLRIAAKRVPYAVAVLAASAGSTAGRGSATTGRISTTTGRSSSTWRSDIGVAVDLNC